MSKVFLTAADVASMLKINVDTIYTLIRRQDLPAIRIGGQWRLEESEVSEWLEKQRDSTIAGHAQGATEKGPK